MMSKSNLYLIVTCICVLIIVVAACKSLEQKIDYSTQVKPILNKHCIACHGGVKKQGGFSLLFEEEAKAKSKSGKYAIVPGDADASEMIKRLTIADHEERMPYRKDKLADEDIEILTKWVDQGAVWGEHWAFLPVQKLNVPSVSDDFVQNQIDAFVIEKAQENDLQMSPKADPQTLVRRLALDINGYPIQNQQVKAYLANPNQNNYKILVDSLLALPSYGEKWTSMWLDLARYADTKGYERDGKRNIWRYRDWVIDAFNKDMPYNQFITEQLAGDLMPNPTDNQYIATAFHRNTMTNDEGGTDNEEYRTAAVLDRVNTTWEALMGTTMACVQCHSHPYDPIKHEDYYRFMSFFNNTKDEDTHGDYPILRHFDDKNKAKLNEVERWLAKTSTDSQKKELIHFIKTFQPTLNSLNSDTYVNAELNDTKWLGLRKNSSARIKNINLTGKTNLILRYGLWADYGNLKINIDSVNGQEIANYRFNKKVPTYWQITAIDLKPTAGKHDLYLSYTNQKLPNNETMGVIIDWFYFGQNLPNQNTAEHNYNKKLLFELLNEPLESTPIFLENETERTRANHVFTRGNWLVKGAKVSAGYPSIFTSSKNIEAKNRLDLAKWLTSAQNPLVSRTIVNRVWEQIFGSGLVETLEDMGTQGANPSHQQLLDHLSYKFMHEYNWSIKKLVCEIVLSGTYQQSSLISAEQLAKDPRNKFLARGARVRLSAEQIRDQALAVSGVLNHKMYGPPIMPYQPKGIWASPYDGAKWEVSAGAEQYRRAVYIYWKRTSPYPSMITFDGAGREVCTSRRIKTNTPLQALVTLNDSVYVDLARQLAQKVSVKKQADFEKYISTAYNLVTGKVIEAKKLAILKKLFLESLSKFEKHPTMVAKTACKQLNARQKNEFEALVMVCNAILNLDEVLTKS